MNEILREVVQDQIKKDPNSYEIGDTVKVHQKVKEGTRARIQIFQGIVIAKQNGGVSETFTVRKISDGVGIEKVYPLHSPAIDKIEVVRHGRVRRAKLFYLRDRIGKEARLKDRKPQQKKA
ncbi:MAG TPA: 50S ribosomal protein L19 [Caldisericia bacterium]|mgnify:CR=1 FL=1|nr:MAG: 50S ribosomal protein L19 [bacterium ADurb.Bin132]HNY61907.1 50S ribosomal protein L19 [Caldisericia bacterium]HOC80006.1 50S ribosomal protein L19 [Caldisericia bacterium]HOG70853.1 50S ribosomal protein L19 [Caldisericia bacterium]HPA66243.1 50S ribosomal protein L19 [Caldisericia bacterium]